MDHPQALSNWTRSRCIKLDGLAELSEGMEITVRGERGRFSFIEHVVSPRGDWVTCYGPVTGGYGRSQIRSFDPTRIKTVHRNQKARKANNQGATT